MSTSAAPRRPIRSYVLREGRMTKGQQRALNELWPLYGLDPAATGEPGRIAASRPLVVELGFGDGGALAAMAQSRPDYLFIGIEVHRPGVGSLLLQLEDQQIDNVRVYCHDGVEVLRQCFEPGSIERFHLFFPDPWHKKRHHKRRILSDDFVATVAERLAIGGVFHFATDWQDYAEQGLMRLDNSPLLLNSAGSGRFAERPAWRPETKFERRGQRLGHGVWDILMTRR